MNLFRNRNFLALWLNSTISTLCLSVSWICESWYAVDILHRPNEYGYILLAALIPRLLFMLAGGVVADRFAQASVVALSLLLRAGLMFLLGWLIAAEHVSLSTLLWFAFLYGVLDAAYWPSRDSMLTKIVPKPQLARANSMLLSTSQIGMIAGPALGGFLMASLGFSAVFHLLGMALGVSAVAFALVVRIPPPCGATPGKLNARGFFQDLAEGLAYVRSHPQLSVLMLIYGVANILFMGPFQQSIPLLAAEHADGGASAFGNLWTFFGVGMLLGAVMIGIFPPRKRRFVLIISMLSIQSICLASLAWVDSLSGGIFVTFLIGLVIAIHNVPMTGILQGYSAEEKIGRVMGCNDTMTFGLVPLSYLGVAMLLGSGASYRLILAVAGTGMLLFCLFAMARFPVIRMSD